MASKRRLRRRYGCAARRTHHNIQKCCKDKQAFDTFDEAEGEMLRLMAAPYYDGKTLNTYRCPFSFDEPHFHFGHLPKELRTHGN
jgi:hypothetical protein